MSKDSNTRRTRHAQPTLENLEGRELLSGQSAAGIAAHALPPNLSKVFAYRANDGAQVVIKLYGTGGIDITKSKYDPLTDALDLIFSGTNASTGLIAQVHGGSGHERLHLLRSAVLNDQSQSGIGTTPLNIANFKNFDLVSGGRVDLTAGVHLLFLNSVAPNTTINLRELPETSNPSTTASSSENGVNTAFVADLTGAQTLTTVGGSFVPAFNTLVANPSSTTSGSNPGVPPAPPGVVIKIDHVNGPSHTGGIGQPHIFGYDPTAQTLYRFAIDPNTSTGTPDRAINLTNVLTGKNAASPGVALGWNLDHLDVLVSDGAKVYAFNALTGNPDGSFTTANVTPLDPNTNQPDIVRVGTFDGETVLEFPNTGPSGLGELQPIGVAQSLVTGSAVTLGTPVSGLPQPPSGPNLVAQPYFSQREFGFSGGLSGVPGSNQLFTAGGGYFDTSQPNKTQLGVAALSQNAGATGLTLSEASRTAVKARNTTINTNQHGAPPVNPDGNLFSGLGNYNLNLALLSGRGLDPKTNLPINNQVTLINPSTLAASGSLTLNDPNALSDLSGTFYPNLGGTSSPSTNVALINVLGNTQSFRAHDTQGLVFNGEGNVNLMKIDSATDTTILGFPFGHAEMPVRNGDTVILSSNRIVATRNGVVDNPPAQPTGPLFLP